MGRAALHKMGRALAKAGRAVGRTASSACCCGGGKPGPCGAVVGEGCQCNPPCVGPLNEYARLRRFSPDGTAMVVWQRPQRCCCGGVQNSGGRAALSFHQRDLFNGCVVREIIVEYTSPGYPAPFSGTYRVIGRDAGNGCALISDQTNHLTRPNPGFCGQPGYSPELGIGCGAFSGTGGAAGMTATEYVDCTSVVIHAQFVDPSDPRWTGTRDCRFVYDPLSQGCDPSCDRGACCCDGDCYDQTSAAECAAMHGVYRGNGSLCLDADCGLTGGRTRGACCLPSGECELSSPAWCAQRGGVYQGDGSACAQVSCPPPPEFACCLPDRTCRLLTQAACAKAGGSWHQNLSCAQVSCLQEPRGACCLSDGTCVLSTGGECGVQGGVYRGDNTDCATSPCTGACCSAGACAITTPQACAGFFLGFGTTCDPNPCGGGGTIQPILGVNDFVRTGSGAFR